ncbi:MAG: YheU family protein [Myxococcales bacterium]|nr:YheU family protein [Myxococcales bacterium]
MEIEPEQLSADALRGLIREFVTRDGTDYGEVELGEDEKLARAEKLVAEGKARIVFDPENGTANIVLARDLPPRA